jgi:hypothetical protein
VRRELFIIAAAFLAAAGGAEAYLRAFAPQQLMSPAYDDRFGMRGFKANAKIKHQTPDYKVVYTTNDLGFRGPSYPFSKPKGTYRIVALGSSVVFGSGVPDDEVFTARLERRLRSELKPNLRTPAEVVNLGMMGTSLSLDEYVYRELGRRWSPDLVVLHLSYPSQSDLTLAEAERWEAVPVAPSSGLKARLRRAVRALPGYAFLCENSHLYGLRRASIAGAAPAKPKASPNLDELQRTFLSTFKALEDEACSGGAKLLLLADRGSLERFPLIDAELKREAKKPRCLSVRELDLGEDRLFIHDRHWSSAGHAYVADQVFAFVRTGSR